MKKTVITVSVIILVLIVGIVSAFLIGGNKEQTENNEPVQEEIVEKSEEKEDQEVAEPEKKEDKTEEKKEEKTQKQAEEKVYVPTFMYFVSNADKDAVAETLDKLKKEFEGKVTFDIVNVDENPDAKKNFPVEGNTPMLIMLNTKNDISAFAPKCTGYDELKLQIEKALEVE